MERVTISLDGDLAADFDAIIAARGYRSRSEAVRDILRTYLEEARRLTRAQGQCVATLAYVFNRGERALAERLAELQHEHHDLTVAAMRTPLDHDDCLESVILKGSVANVRGMADQVTSLTGVRHAELHVISVESGDRHAHGGVPHAHLKPKY